MLIHKSSGCGVPTMARRCYEFDEGKVARKRSFMNDDRTTVSGHLLPFNWERQL
ncbi:hypothetical protein JKG47_14830 [Acidithiobacillus sp. MC6.1]|nr:hypothetical protein [Acidithiobacillus sp. MC6.1]